MQGERVQEAGTTVTHSWRAQVRATGAGAAIRATGDVCRSRERARGVWNRRAQLPIACVSPLLPHRPPNEPTIVSAEELGLGTTA